MHCVKSSPANKKLVPGSKGWHFRSKRERVSGGDRESHLWDIDEEGGQGRDKDGR